MAPKVIYITGFRQHAGKTVTSLGLLSLLTKVIEPSRIAYIKPVGQKVDVLPNGIIIEKDAHLIKEFSGLTELDLTLVSPVILASGFTKKFLSTSDPVAESRRLKDRIAKAVKALSDKEIIIAEGTGHPGVGGIVGLSNAKVANLIDAEIIFLSGGGIGKALDMLEVDLSYFLYKKSRVRGIIFNKLLPDKISTVKQYITEDLLNKRFGAVGGQLSILGFFPQINSLQNPSMRILKREFAGCQVLGDPDDISWSVPPLCAKMITLATENFIPERFLVPQALVVAKGNKGANIRKIIQYNQNLIEKDEAPLAGLILTGAQYHDLENDVRDAVLEANIPSIFVQEDIATAEAKILQLFENTKLELFDRIKIDEIESLFEQHFDMEKFLESFQISV
ncbi:MAG: AAA family ATPase [Spirochaetales bacterium]|nr:AAA family ATPase [Spirochaetales bacterium]